MGECTCCTLFNAKTRRPSQRQHRIALLIDCDHVSHNSIEGVLEEIAKYGKVNVRHAHGDWNSGHLAGWIENYILI